MSGDEELRRRVANLERQARIDRQARELLTEYAEAALVVLLLWWVTRK